MAWLRIALTDEEQRVVHEERESHPELLVRRKLLVLWSLHCGLKREQAAKLAGVARSTVERMWRPSGRRGWPVCGGVAGRVRSATWRLTAT